MNIESMVKSAKKELLSFIHSKWGIEDDIEVVVKKKQKGRLGRNV